MIAEIIFSIIAFCVIWYVIYTIRLRIEDTKRLKNIAKKIEKQNKKLFVDGKEVDLKKQIGIK